MRSAPEAFFGKGDNCSIRSSRLSDVKPSSDSPQARGRSCESAQRSVWRAPSNSQRQPGMAHHDSVRAVPQISHDDFVVHAEGHLTCGPGRIHFFWRSAPSTVILPRYSPGCDNAWALGPTEWFSRPTQAPWAGSFAAPVSPAMHFVESRATFGRATVTRDSKPRFGLTSCGRKVGSPKVTARFESVYGCMPDRHFVGPCPISTQR
jgi:hypothetical protein